MKLLTALLLFTFLIISLQGQVITGKVIDSSNGEPLEYTSIGVIGTPIGTITDQDGHFNIDITGQPADAIVRFSMISYLPQVFTIAELINKENTIKFIPASTQLAEVVIRPLGKLRKAGTSDYSPHEKGFWGWRGADLGKGHEKGTKIELGHQPVKLTVLHIHVHYSCYDTTVLRLHVRNIVQNMPSDELLSSNILIAISTRDSSWVDVDLSKYNLVFKEDIALTLEWVKVIGIHFDKYVPKEGSDERIPLVYFNLKKKRGGCLYVRHGPENEWILDDKSSPSIFLTVQELKYRKNN